MFFEKWYEYKENIKLFITDMCSLLEIDINLKVIYEYMNTCEPTNIVISDFLYINKGIQVQVEDEIEYNTYLLIVLHYYIFNTYKEILITSSTYTRAKEILFDIKEIYQKLPNFLQTKPKRWLKTVIKNESDNEISIGSINDKYLGKGLTINFILFDNRGN